MLVVNSSLPAKSVQELIALAKAQPGQITAASSGVGTTNHLSLEMFKSMARVDLLHVPYKGGGPAIADLVGGQVKVHFNTPGTLFPHVKSGRLRALAMTSAQRADFAPDIPTVAESGVPGFEATVWYGVYGPRTLPARLVQRWSDAINRYIKTPQAQEHLRRIDMIGGGGTPGALRRLSQERNRALERGGQNRRHRASVGLPIARHREQTSRDEYLQGHGGEERRGGDAGDPRDRLRARLPGRSRRARCRRGAGPARLRARRLLLHGRVTACRRRLSTPPSRPRANSTRCRSKTRCGSRSTRTTSATCR